MQPRHPAHSGKQPPPRATRWSRVRTRLGALYFGPWRWELASRGRIYEWFGIRLWKWFLRTSMNPQSVPLSRRDVGGRREYLIYRLSRHARFTRRFELRHLLGGLVMQASGVCYILYADEGSVLVLSAINMLVNGFPILLQRYNRIRVVVALARIEQPTGTS